MLDLRAYSNYNEILFREKWLNTALSNYNYYFMYKYL